MFHPHILFNTVKVKSEKYTKGIVSVISTLSVLFYFKERFNLQELYASAAPISTFNNPESYLIYPTADKQSALRVLQLGLGHLKSGQTIQCKLWQLISFMNGSI